MRRLLSLVTPDSTRLDDEAVLRSTYAAHADELYGFARNQLHDAGLAEEVVQETFLRAWKAADRFDESAGSLRTWLFAICRNVVIDVKRRQAVRPIRTDREEQDADFGITDNEFETMLTSMQVEEALRRLSDEHRHVLIETFYKGRPAIDVAADMHVPAGTVRSRQYYALKALRLVLEEMGWADD